MKYKLTYLFFLFTLTAALAGCLRERNGRRKPSLAESYNKKDNNPFGTNVAFRQLEALYNNNTVRERRQPFNKTWNDISDTSSLYVCIAHDLFVTEEEVNAMMDYVSAGNDLFIAAGYIDTLLLKRIGCNEMYSPVYMESISGTMKNTFSNAVAAPDSSYSYYYFPFQNHFINIDSSNTRVLGYNEDHKPNSIVHFYGSGKLFLHCDPRAFSNYFLLKKENYKYLQNTMAYTYSQPDHLYWDDYYNKLRFRKGSGGKDFSTFSEIMKHPPLAWAFWIALILLSLYILFGFKRFQRVIEQLRPNENTTVTFTETIGRLYLQKKDNRNIADKMVTYFNEYIRNKYFLNTNAINEDFITALSRKSGVQKDKVETLYRNMAGIHSSADVNDYQLLSLHEQIQNFYKNKS